MAAHRTTCGKVKRVGLLLHGLHRTFATDAEEAGMPRHQAMAFTGHKKESVYKRYAIENRERGRAAIDKLDAYRAEQRKARDNSGTNEVFGGSANQQQVQ